MMVPEASDKLGEPISLPLPQRRPASDPSIKSSAILWLMVLHLLVGVALGTFPSVAPLHALGTLAIAFWCALTDRSLVRMAYAAAYITGSEALWRMTDASVVWELGKYSMAGAMVFAMLRHGRVRPYWPPIIFLLLLLPSAALTFTSVDVYRARQLVSFDLSGPISLGISVLFFSRVRLTPRELARTLMYYLAPSLAVGVVIALGLSQEDITFGRSSLAAASGGFGPNQISASLGLASLCCFLIVTSRAVPGVVRIWAGCGILIFATQSALTFSRCGLYYFCGGTAIALLVLLRNPQMAVRLSLFGTILAVAAYFFILPWLDVFTGGALSRRFQNTDLTNRDKIMAMDLRIFAQNPLFGIGVGRGKEARQAMEHRAASHTEYTRLLAEHGIFGGLAIVVLVWMGLRHFLKAAGPHGKAVAVAMIAYSMLYLVGNGMRQVLPAFAFGLAAVTFLSGGPRRSPPQSSSGNVTTLEPAVDPAFPHPNPVAAD